MKITAVKGANDYLPAEVQIRDYLQSVILETYQSCGFQRIMTPILEDIENLDKSEGGENLNLIFKVLKRGDKLRKALDTENLAEIKENDLADMGLRYDLTLPLTRYYANNRAKLTTPLKCIQIDRVYRAERPQKGRLRELMQCDIDIIGDSSYTAEIQLVTTTATALLAVGIDEFRVKVNDRRLLKALLENCGFAEKEMESVCITFDKLDKIGAEGVKEELEEKGFAKEAIKKLLEMLEVQPFTLADAAMLCGENHPAVASLKVIMDSVRELSEGKYEIVYDMSLVRGQGYYTGTVFEVESPKFNGAIAGGGRYDNLIGKFINENVPAVGFSIGFERIFSILMSMDFQIPGKKDKIALIYDRVDCIAAMKKANELRVIYDVALFERPKKVGKFLEKLKTMGYDGFLNFGISEQVSELK